jgi:hypothetical protein
VAVVVALGKDTLVHLVVQAVAGQVLLALPVQAAPALWVLVITVAQEMLVATHLATVEVVVVVEQEQQVHPAQQQPTAALD